MQHKERGLEFHGFGEDSKYLVLLLCAVVAAALAVAVGRKMTTEAMAVVVGIVCGIAASIPTSLLLLVVLVGRDRRQSYGPDQQVRPTNGPPVVVIPGGGQSQEWPLWPQADYVPQAHPGPAAGRQFHVVGGDGMTVDG